MERTTRRRRGRRQANQIAAGHDRAVPAVLAMVRTQAVVATQKDLFGEIALQRHISFDAVFASEPAAGGD